MNPTIRLIKPTFAKKKQNRYKIYSSTSFFK
jgi:hypothetical protein